jgi:hypothetical protein
VLFAGMRPPGQQQPMVNGGGPTPMSNGLPSDVPPQAPFSGSTFAGGPPGGPRPSGGPQGPPRLGIPPPLGGLRPPGAAVGPPQFGLPSRPPGPGGPPSFSAPQGAPPGAFAPQPPPMGRPPPSFGGPLGKSFIGQQCMLLSLISRRSSSMLLRRCVLQLKHKQLHGILHVLLGLIALMEKGPTAGA